MSREEYQEYKERKNKRKGSEIKSHRDKRIPPNVKCYICQGNHYKHNCPKLKSAKKVINMLTEEELNAIMSNKSSSEYSINELYNSSSDISEYYTGQSEEEDNMVVYSETETECGSNCKCTECLNCIYAFSIKNENEFLKAILNTEDPFARSKLKEQFMRQKKKYYYKVQGRQRISHQLNFVTERKDELSLHEKSLQIQKQLERPTTQKHVQDLAKRFEKVYSEHPGMFWHIRKHTVDLPFDNNFKGVPHRSRAIPMDAEHVNVDTN
jgi:hypothetical protein